MSNWIEFTFMTLILLLGSIVAGGIALSEKQESSLSEGNFIGADKLSTLELNQTETSIIFKQEKSEKPSITIWANNTNLSILTPPYDVELNMNNCKQVTCECSYWGCLAYCFICDDDINLGAGETNG